MAEVDELLQEPSESEKRIKQLSKKASEESAAREEADKGKAEAEARASAAERKAQFLNDFADVLGKNPDAKDFKGDIETKVMAGYSVEDATYAVLGKAGKLGSSAVEIESAAGGSASNAISSAPAEKSIGDMTQAERRAELSSRADLVDILAPKRQ